MKQIVIFICCLLPKFIFAQSISDHTFKNFENWQQVLNTARATNKNIFIDAYASWCGPCKEMDTNVYTKKSVYQLLDSNFVSVKVQMDKSKSDPPEIVKWYDDAAILFQKYHIEAFPSFIFLSPNGELIQVTVGYHDVPAFLKVLREAANPLNAYSSQVKLFEAGKLKVEDILELSVKASDYKDDSLAIKMARSYKDDYFDKNKLSNVIKPGLAQFVSKFSSLFSVNDPLIKYCYNHPLLADSMLQSEGFSTMIVGFYISRDIVDPFTSTAEENGSVPNWTHLQSGIAKKYNKKLAEKITTETRLSWYYGRRDWENIIKFELEKVERYGIDTSLVGRAALNNMIYSVIFKHTNNPVYLNKGIEYMKTLIDGNLRDTWLDTYAGLLYKTGKKNEALQYQERALALAKQKNNENATQEYQKTLNKMKNGQSIW